MSPQQLRGGQPTVADDVYALGASLYELLTGKPPFHTGDLTHQVLHEPPTPVTERALQLGVDNPVPDQVAALIMACLAKESDQRPKNAAAVAEWIESAPSESFGHLTPGNAGASSRKIWMWAGGSLALLLLVGGFFLLMGGKSKSGGHAPDSSTQSPSPAPLEGVWVPLDIGGACSADIISTASRKAANQFTYNGGTFASASWLRANGYQEPGLPDNGRIPIPDSNPPGFFQVRMPPSRNAILLSGPEGAHPQPVTVELTDKDRGRYSELVILHTTCWGDGSLRVTLRYEGGSEASLSLPLFDWFPAGRTGPLPNGLRVAVTSHDTHPTGGQVAQVLAQSIRVDPQRILVSLTLSFESMKSAAPASRKNFTSGIFALSALPASVPTAAASARWTNTLGMVFVPVPGTDVQFSIWETRVRDFEAFVNDTAYDATQGMLSLRRDGWKPRGDTWKRPGFTQTPTHPACGLSWNDAAEFCRWLTKREQAAATLTANQSYRLPTDAEWSSAVGMAVTTIGQNDAGTEVYPWGTQWPPPAQAGNYAGTEAANADWQDQHQPIAGFSDGWSRTAPVGSFNPNPLGLYDLGGNVWEWCEDLFNGQSATNILRGGSWFGRDKAGALSSRRLGRPASSRNSDIGFRVVLSSGLAKAAPAAKLPAGLVLHYSFDGAEPGDRVTDLSGLNNHGQAVNAHWTAEGKKGGGFQFGPVFNFIRVTNSDSLNPQYLTMAVWIRTTFTDQYWRRIFDKGWDTGYTLGMAGDSRDGTGKSWQGQAYAFILKKGNSYSKTTVADGRWHHLAATFDGSFQRFYLDGTEVGDAVAWNGSIGRNSHNLTIGCDQSTPDEYTARGTASFSGTMDDVMLFNRALSAAEIRALYDSRN